MKLSTGKGLLVVLSAPSGAGKTTILGEVLSRHPEICFSVSVTTRPPRKNEENGRDYYFVSESEFDKLIEDDKLAEWAKVHGNRYGTLKSTVEEALEKGLIMVFDTDTVGAFNLRKSYPQSVLVFLIPPSPDILEQRLISRSTESPNSREARLAAAPFETALMRKYDYIIINDDIKKAAERFCSILEAESLKSWRIIPLLSSWRPFVDGPEKI